MVTDIPSNVGFFKPKGLLNATPQSVFFLGWEIVFFFAGNSAGALFGMAKT